MHNETANQYICWPSPGARNIMLSSSVSSRIPPWERSIEQSPWKFKKRFGSGNNITNYVTNPVTFDWASLLPFCFGIIFHCSKIILSKFLGLLCEGLGNLLLLCEDLGHAHGGVHGKSNSVVVNRAYKTRGRMCVYMYENEWQCLFLCNDQLKFVANKNVDKSQLHWLQTINGWKLACTDSKKTIN